MITNLHIKNIGIIDDLEINLNKGMNVLTGETGAGKTLIIDSLGIISGGRFSKEMIRKGENHSYVEINIYAPEDSCAGDLRGLLMVARRSQGNWRWEGPLGTPRGLVHWKRASSPVEAGTSGFL